MKVRQDILLFAHLRAREDKNTMNRIMFYNKLDKYHLAHATDEWGKQYYNKLDNYYPSGKARYFYSKEEWDAYQREQQGKAQDQFKKQQEAKKTAEAKNNMSGYSDWKKGQEQKEAAKVSQQNKLAEINNEEKNKNAEVYNKNKNAADAEAERQKAKIEAQKKADEVERIKYEGKKNLEKKIAEDKWKRQQEEAKKRVEEREQRAELARKNQEAKEASMNKSRETFREQVKKQEREELARKNKEAQEASMKKSQDLAREESAKREAVNKYKTTSNTELDQQYTATKNLIEQCNNSKDEIQFKLDNLLVDELKTEIASQDPEFISKWNGDLTNYLQPWNDGWYWFINGHDDGGHGKIASDALDKVVNKYKTAIDNTKYDDISGNNQTYLEKKKEEYDREIESDIVQDIAKAKLSLIKVHQGDSKNFEIDPSLKKILENKLEQIDEKYDGDLYDYIKPYFGLSFLPDNASYQNIEDILNEMEEELKSGKDPYGVYAEYYNNIKDAVYNA